MLTNIACRAQEYLDRCKVLDFTALLFLRLYLAPIFIIAGLTKLDDWLLPSSNTVSYFEHLGLPFPTVMTALAGWTELFGGIALLIGLAVRWASIPLMATMAVAALSVHWKNGWLAIAEGAGFFATERTQDAIERLSAAKSILREHGNYSWLTEHGNFVVLNNGIEFAATYFLMLLVLFFYGAGRYLSFDYWIARRCAQ